MQIFMVVPTTTNVRKFRASPGFRAFIGLGSAIEDIEARYRERARRVSGWSFASGTAPVPIVAEIPTELFSTCACTPNVRCEHNEYLELDNVMGIEAVLKQPIAGWTRVMREHVKAWEVEQRMLGRELKRWVFHKEWLPSLPSASDGAHATMKR